MLAVRRILYPTDQSESAEHAYGTAARLAAGLGASLHVLHVIVPDIDDRGRDVDETALTPSPPPDGVEVVRAVERHDSVGEGITSYCGTHDIDLVVIGTRGRSGLGRLFVGSVAERVVREAPCPVITVPSRAPGQAFSSVLAAVDFSDYSRTTLEHAAAFAGHYGARLDVVHVLQEMTVPSAYGPELAPVVTPELEERSRSALEKLISEVSSAIDAEAQVVFGYPATEILRFAEEYGTDLIVMATHGLTGLEHFLIGSVTEKVVRRAKCPVLTVRSFGRAVVGPVSR